MLLWTQPFFQLFGVHHIQVQHKRGHLKSPGSCFAVCSAFAKEMQEVPVHMVV